MCTPQANEFGIAQVGGPGLWQHHRDNWGDGGGSGTGKGVQLAPPEPNPLDLAAQSAARSRLARKRVLRGQSLLAAGAREKSEDALIEQPMAMAKDRLGA